MEINWQTVALLLSAASAGGIIIKLLDIAHENRKSKREDQKAKENKESVYEKAIRSILASDIERRCEKYVSHEEVRLRDLTRLEEDWKLYHFGMGGNGYLDGYMNLVREIRVIPDEA